MQKNLIVIFKYLRRAHAGDAIRLVRLHHGRSGEALRVRWPAYRKDVFESPIMQI